MRGRYLAYNTVPDSLESLYHELLSLPLGPFALRKRWLLHLLSIRLIAPTVAPWQPVAGVLNLLQESYVSRVPMS